LDLQDGHSFIDLSEFFYDRRALIYIFQID
jgi:hypothetical protein